MPVFHYRAVKQDGKLQRGHLTAAHEQELSQLLAASGLELIDARFSQNTNAHFSQNSNTRFSRDTNTRFSHDKEKGIFFFQKIKSEQTGKSLAVLRQKILLCAQLRDLLQSGFDVREAFDSAASLLPAGPFCDAVLSIKRDLEQGSRLSAAFAAQGTFFDAVFRGLLQTGDATGDLGKAFTNLTTRLENEERFRKKLRKALRYPLFLLLVALSTTAFMMNFVVPEILVFLETIATDLPPSTRLLINISSFFSHYWLYGLGSVFLGLLLHQSARKLSENYALRSDKALLSFPLAGDVFHYFELARFAGSLSALLQSGLDVSQALPVATGSLGNRALHLDAETAAQDLQNGASISAAFADFFPTLVVQMLKMGEKSGNITKKLSEASCMLEDKATEKTDRLISAIEPLLTALIGAMLAWIVLAVLGPVYGSIQTLSATM